MSSRVKIALAAALACTAPCAGQDEAAVTASYLATLRSFAEGQPAAAFTRLGEVESRFVDADRGDELRALERRAIGSVVARDTGTLAAFILFHHDAFQHFREAQRPRLAAHALRMVVDLAGSTESRAAERPTKQAASRSLVSLAGDVVQLNPPDALELLRRAIDLDPLDGPALLAIGAIYEKYGDYSEAVGALKRRVAIGADPEARLRLAINLRRTGDAEQAEPMLDALATGDAEDWIRVLASQELASLLSRSGRVREAIPRLRSAIQRHPMDGTLRLQLSYALERSGQAGAALETAEEAIGLRLGAVAESAENPRLLYNRWPMHVFRQAAVELRQAVEPRLELLSGLLRSEAPAKR